MARIGGRNAAFAWVVGVGCAAIFGALLYLAWPMLPASVAWVKGAAGEQPAATVSSPTPSATGTGEAGRAAPASCDELYDDALRAEMRFSEGATVSSTTDAPRTSAESLVAAVQPRVVFTCTWTADAGTVSTTFAQVPADAGEIAAAVLPSAGFACEKRATSVRCVREDGDRSETIEAGRGRWLSTSEDAWHPSDYANRTATRVWG